MESMSYSMTSSGNKAWYFSRRSLPSRMFFSAQQRFFPTKPLAPVTRTRTLLHRLVLAALECQLHVLGGLDLGDGARNVETLRVVGGVGLVGLGLHLAVDDELVVVQVARVAGDAVVAAHVLGAQALLAGHEGLEELLAVAGADDLGAHAAEDLLHGLGEVADRGGGGLLDEQVAGVGVLEGELHQVHGLVQVHQESGHVGVGDRQRLPFPDAVDEQRDDAAARAHDVAVAGAADGGAAGAVAGVGVDDGLHHGLGLAHGVDGVGRLVGGQAHDAVHALLDRGVEHVVRADYVGAHGLHGEELAGGHLLQGGGVEDVVHAVHGVAHALGVADVADEEADLGGELRGPLLQAVAHVVLLLLVAREDADLGQVGVHEVLEHGVAERAGAARDHEGLVFECGGVGHSYNSLLKLVNSPRASYVSVNLF